MATRKPPAEPAKAELTLDQLTRGSARLQRRLEQVQAFDPQKVNFQDPSSSVRPRSEAIETALQETFGYGTIEHGRFRKAASFNWPISMLERVPPAAIANALAKERQKAIDTLEAAIALLQERLEDAPAETTTVRTSSVPSTSRRIFIVHGRDDGQKETIARYLQTIGFDPVILHEQPNKGRTSIQKFREEASDVGFAVALLTPDDTVIDGSVEHKRARQNVILELGFFLGVLGPERVAALVKAPVEIPSDYNGVVYISLDQADWKVNLAKELQASGYSVDWNKVMR